VESAVLEAYGRRFDVCVPDDDHIGKRLSAGNWYERDLLEDFRKRIPARGMALDIGAHIGNHTLWMAGICDLQVIAIEPNPATFALLVENVKSNGLDDQVDCYHMAAGSEPARASLVEECEGNSGMVRTVIDSKGAVEVMTVDGLGLESLAVMKIDTEGSELAVLEGAKETIARCHPIIYVETAVGGGADAWLLAAGYQSFGRFCWTPTWGYEWRGPA